MSDFKGRRFPIDVILLCVRWYCKYGVSYRDLEEMMSERGARRALTGPNGASAMPALPRFARNGALVRILNKFPEPPNKDVGEGLNTAFKAMHDQGLKEPLLLQKENDVWAVIRHEALASPEEAIMDYLSKNETINNSEAREVTHIKRDHQVKAIFGRMAEANMIGQVPGTRTANTRYRRKQVSNE